MRRDPAARRKAAQVRHLARPGLLGNGWFALAIIATLGGAGILFGPAAPADLELPPPLRVAWGAVLVVGGLVKIFGHLSFRVSALVAGSRLLATGGLLQGLLLLGHYHTRALLPALLALYFGLACAARGRALSRGAVAP